MQSQLPVSSVTATKKNCQYHLFEIWLMVQNRSRIDCAQRIGKFFGSDCVLPYSEEIL